MDNLVPDSSSFLSKLLHEVVGTEEMIKIRRDYCKIADCFMSDFVQRTTGSGNIFFTGSKAEGLDLPGSDEDYMYEINNLYGFRMSVIQSMDDMNTCETYIYNEYLMVTEYVPPGFTLLQCVRENILANPILYLASESVNGVLYLSSDSLLNIVSSTQQVGVGYLYSKTARQGPSIESWSEYQDLSESGRDSVPCVRCSFWPNSCEEWIQRTRHFQWPTASDMESIVDFGFHLVSVGHPNSQFKRLEWRMSFSIAERTLVWSFNQIQMQIYAVVKIILKEFIKVKCSPQNQILCSYFIKTFLFWTFEETDPVFWRADNFHNCYKFVLAGFVKCIREGVLRHYFFPEFNLLSVKLTREAQTELIRLFDIIIQCDVSIFKECETLRSVWLNFIKYNGNKDVAEQIIAAESIFTYDNCMMVMVNRVSQLVYEQSSFFNTIRRFTSRLLGLPCETPLLSLAMNFSILHEYILKSTTSCSSNKDIYRLTRITQYNAASIDISTCKIRYAIMLLMKGDYASTLTTVNQVLSSIPPYALYNSDLALFSSEDIQDLYADVFINSSMTTTTRAKTSWLFDLVFVKHEFDVIPLAIQIELHFSDAVLCLHISPFTIAYYLLFMCYHGQRDYESRNHALRQLIEVTNNKDQYGAFLYHSYNIAGHCLLVTGDITRARDMFAMSYQITEEISPLSKYNSAMWYLQNFT